MKDLQINKESLWPEIKCENNHIADYIEDYSLAYWCSGCWRPYETTVAKPFFHECSRSSIAQSSSSRVSKSKSGDSVKSSRSKKGILDLDRHCGVLVAPSGVPCMRSLTCKSHSMASKRAVIGRTIDFDKLLSMHQVGNSLKASKSNLSSPHPSITDIRDGRDRLLSFMATDTGNSTSFFAGNFEYCHIDKIQWLSYNYGNWVTQSLGLLRHPSTKKDQ